MPGTVLPVPASGLLRQKIRYVFLAATTRGEGVGGGYSPVAQGEVENCIRDCFARFDELAQAEPMESILFPVFGAGTAKQDPEQSVAWMLPIIVEALAGSQACRRCCVLAWVESHRTALHQVAVRLGLKRQGGPP
jgi:hypothetical protein